VSYTSKRSSPIKVGFWKGLDPKYDDGAYPDVRIFVDPSWDRAERNKVIGYVSDSRFLGSQYRGWSDCRVCGKMNGSADYTDGVYVWPEGFAHYLREHAVRPPSAFIAHVLKRLR
jgi:hypothetical protein